MTALKTLAALKLPSAYIAAGFVRNAIWDNVFHQGSTPLNDVDVIYFDDTNVAKSQDELWQQCLIQAMPSMNWEVKNQARMHIKHQHCPYQNCIDAMSYWPEKETAIAVRLIGDNTLDFVSPYELSALFSGRVTYNPKASKRLFKQRIENKKWLRTWPQLAVKYE